MAKTSWNKIIENYSKIQVFTSNMKTVVLLIVMEISVNIFGVSESTKSYPVSCPELQGVIVRVPEPDAIERESQTRSFVLFYFAWNSECPWPNAILVICCKLKRKPQRICYEGQNQRSFYNLMGNYVRAILFCFFISRKVISRDYFKKRN